jgi:eukaryotic-like serine/threonine-protein kinase
MSLAPPANPLAPGFRLDRYELLWPIAEGGMASVWLARLHGKHGFEKLVAVKTILPKFAKDPRFEAMFLDEARIASGIEHTNVAKILDLGEEHGVLYMAMEWVDGDSLSKLQRSMARVGVPLPQGIVLRIMADACAGLHAAHELRSRDGRPLGIVHRDVSPQNILVSAEGMAKVIDFGVAKARDRASEETSGGALKGKIQYMAPEQALGRPVDRRSDVWAIGAVLYYFFAGRRVYECDSELGTLQLLTSGVSPPPLPASVPPVIRDIVGGALRFNQEERWANLDIVRRRLEQAMIDLRCVVKPEDVANFIATFAQERAAARRTTVAKALQAADARVALEAEKPTVASSSGLSEINGRPPSSLVTNGGAVPVVEPRTLARSSGAETSSSTLGSAALDASAVPVRRSLGIWFGGIAAVGALAAGAAGLIYVLRTSGSSAAASRPAATTPATATSPVAAPTPPPPATGASNPSDWQTIVPDAGVAAAASPPATGQTPTSADGPAPKANAMGAPTPAKAPAVAPRKTPAKRASKGTDTDSDDGF